MQLERVHLARWGCHRILESGQELRTAAFSIAHKKSHNKLRTESCSSGSAGICKCERVRPCPQACKQTGDNAQQARKGTAAPAQQRRRASARSWY